MAVKGKFRPTLYVDPENYEIVKEFLDRTKYSGGMSAYVDQYLATTAKTIMAAGIKPGQKLTYTKLFRYFIDGVKREPD